MGQIKGDGGAWHAVRSEPLIREPEVRPKTYAALLELSVELLDSGLENGALDAQIEFAHGKRQEFLVRPVRPLRLVDGTCGRSQQCSGGHHVYATFQAR